jgi:mannitol/fructose-specific phosphotransferase system IIA component (Ntr-type)
VDLVGLTFGAIAQNIGILALFGFFLAGLIAGEARDLSEKTRSIISQMVYAVFVPVFFANIGLKIDVLRSFDMFLVMLFTIVGIGARFIGAYVGVILSRAPRVQRWPVAILHTPGGEMHIVIGTLALQLQLINQTVFVAIIIAAVVSSITLGPWLTHIIKRIIPKETVQIPRDAAIEIVSNDKYSALKELCHTAVNVGGVNFEEIYAAARNREEGMSTGFERGIAIPHARIINLPKPVVVFGRSSVGIDWDSPDGIPAKLLFLIITSINQPDVQLHIYGQILRVLSREEETFSIMEAPNPGKAVDLLNEHLRIVQLNV